MTDDRPILEPMGLIAEYGCLKGWVPIGFRRFTVGPWEITVNGTREPREDVPPFHALVSHRTYVGVMVFSPFEGEVVGFAGTVDEFCRDMRAEITECVA